MYQFIHTETDSRLHSIETVGKMNVQELYKQHLSQKYSWHNRH